MGGPDDAWRLAVWEDARARPAPERPLALLRLASPDAPDTALDGLPLGERERRLLVLHERLFGSTLRGTCDCPGCGARLEVAATTTALLTAQPAGDVTPGAPLAVAAGTYRATCRPPTGADVAAAARELDVAAARRVLLQRCVREVWRGDTPCAVDDLPAAVTAAIAERMEEADPLGDVRLAVECPGCGMAWSAVCDTSTFVLERLHGWAGGVLAEVHALASAYGWSEGEILALGARRRRAYLELIDR